MIKYLQDSILQLYVYINHKTQQKQQLKSGETVKVFPFNVIITLEKTERNILKQ